MKTPLSIAKAENKRLLEANVRLQNALDEKALIISRQSEQLKKKAFCQHCGKYQ
jgi:proline racemase